MSKRLLVALQPTTQCQSHQVRRHAPRAYLFRNDDNSSSHSRPRRLRLQHHVARPFSTTAQCAAVQVRKVKAAQSQPSQPSMNVAVARMKEKVMRTGEMPEDFGILPDTFIMPIEANRPSWFSNWRDRLKLEKARWGVRWRDFRLYFVFWASLHRPPRLRTLSTTAKEAHKEIFANFATGELQSVEKKVCDGMLASLRRRIAQRPPNTSYIWKLHRYITPPALVSFKAYMFPETASKKKIEDRHGVVQAVVRIHSLQSLRPLKRVTEKHGTKTVVKEYVTDARGVDQPLERMMESSQVDSSAKQTVEYVVLQQMYKKAMPGPWKVWGTTEESTLAGLEKKEKEKKSKKEAEKLRKEVEAGKGRAAV